MAPRTHAIINVSCSDLKEREIRSVDCRVVKTLLIGVTRPVETGSGELNRVMIATHFSNKDGHLI